VRNLKVKYVLVAFLALMFSVYTVNHIINIQVNIGNPDQPKTASYSGAYVGLTWTLYEYHSATEQERYMSVKISFVNSTLVLADIYFNGVQAGSGMAIGHIGDTIALVLDDDIIEDCIASYGTYNAVYGGKNLTVTANQTAALVVDTDTGVLVDSVYGSQLTTLVSWAMYDSSNEKISGFLWIFLLISIIASTVYLLRRRYNEVIKL
jgi:hypothetical protein